MPNEITGPGATAVMQSPSVNKCPWKKVENVVVSPSFQELMDCDLASKLQQEEDQKYARQLW